MFSHYYREAGFGHSKNNSELSEVHHTDTNSLERALDLRWGLLYALSLASYHMHVMCGQIKLEPIFYRQHLCCLLNFTICEHTLLIRVIFRDKGQGIQA